MADLTVSGSIDSFMSLTDASAVRFVKFNADNTVSLRSDSDMRADLGLVIGTNVQAYDADLASWAGVTRASGFDTFVATPSSANLAALLTDETGSGANVFATSPTLTTPALANQGTGAFTATLTHNGTMTANRTLTLDLANGSRSLTLGANVVIGSGASLTVSAATSLNQNLTTTSSPTFSNLTASGSITVASAVATPAGGSTSARLLFGTTAGFGIYYGSGAPTVSAAQGSIYIRSDGSSSSTRLYVNTDGATTWTNFTSAT